MASGEGALKVKRIGKVFLDYAPALCGLVQGFTTDEAVLYGTVWAAAIVALLSIVADYFHCKRRWANGQLAVWPKMIALVFFVLYTCMVVLLYSNVLSIKWVQTWGGCFTTSGLLVASAASLVVGKPFVYANAVEFLPPERLEQIATDERARVVFDAIMRAITLLWTAVFAVLTLTAFSSAVIRESGHEQVATILGVAAPIIIILITAKIMMPKIIEKTKAKHMNQLRTSGRHEAV